MYQGIITRSAAVFLLATLCPAAYAFGVEFPDDDGEGVIRSAAMDVTDEFIKQLGSASKGTQFEFSLFDDVSFVADTERVEKTEDGFSWIGKIAKEDVGDVILSVVDGDLAGTVWVDTQIYNIHGDGDGGYTVDEIDSTALELAHDADTSPSQPNRRTLPSFLLSRPRVVDRLLAREEGYKRLRGRIQGLVTAGLLPAFILSFIPESGARVDVLLVTTPSAEEWMETNGHHRTATINNLIEKANTALRESLIDSQLNLVGLEFVDYDPVDPELLTDLGNLADPPIHSDLLFLHTRRDELRADIVSLLVHQSNPVNAGRGKTLGMLPAVTVTPPDGKGQFEEKGFNVVDIKYAVRENAFTHEIGHNYGSQHDRFQFEIEKAEVAPQFVPSIPGAHGFILPEVNVRTVMAYDTFCQETFGFSCSRIPRFSNPDQFHHGVRRGVALGLPISADNASMFNLTARVVANYRHALVQP